ncbi:OB-fold-containig protein [Rhodophyticola porphyridii]|uniref:OB-fold-containig protein n=1 Tax=Rhodophyticola porphyridii TaxID=1852017 RepID=UPI0035CF19FE
MLDTLLSGAYAPFTLSLALLFGLLALELVFAIMGATLLGAGGGEPEVEIDLPDLANVPELDLDMDFDALDIDPAEFELPSAEDFAPDLDTGAAAGSATGVAAWLGLGRVPALIWLGAVLLAFGVSGIVIQNAATALWAALPAALASLPAVLAAIWFARSFGAVFARAIPKTETQSVAARSLARRKGTVTQGTARTGTPAEVRVTDRYGNSHYLRAEPFRPGEEIPQGAEVLVLRHRPTGGFRLIPLSD